MKSQQQQQYQEKRTIHFAISSSNKNRSKRLKKQMNIHSQKQLFSNIIFEKLFLFKISNFDNEIELLFSFDISHLSPKYDLFGLNTLFIYYNT